MAGSLLTEEVFFEKYNLYSDMIFRISMSFTRDIDTVEDVMQDVFISLLYKAPNFKSPEHEKFWMIRVAINICKDKCKNKNSKNLPLDVLNDITASEETNELYFLMQEVPEKYRMPIHLYHIEGFSVKEIAKMLSIGESAVKMRLMRGRELLRYEMEEER